MTYRVGMTTNPEHSEKYWNIKYPESYLWEVLGTYGTKSEAQAAVKAYAQKFGGHPITGEDGPENASWAVYKFQY